MYATGENIITYPEETFYLVTPMKAFFFYFRCSHIYHVITSCVTFHLPHRGQDRALISVAEKESHHLLFVSLRIIVSIVTAEPQMAGM